jgi:hypothetical protein
MKIYWFAWQIPEFADMPKSEAIRINRIYFFKSYLHFGHWIGMGVFAAAISIWDWMIQEALPFMLDVPFISERLELLLLVFWSGVGGFFYVQIVIATIRHIYRRDMKAKGNRG